MVPLARSSHNVFPEKNISRHTCDNSIVNEKQHRIGREVPLIAKKNTIFILMAAMVVSMTISGCGGTATAEASAEETAVVVKNEEKQETELGDATKKLTEDAANAFFNGIRDRYVLIDAKDIDYLHVTEYSKSIVTDVTVDDSGVDTSKAGEYTVRYVVTVNKTNLEKAKAYMKQHPEIYGTAATDVVNDVADTVNEAKKHAVDDTKEQDAAEADADITADDSEEPEDISEAEETDAEQADTEETNTEDEVETDTEDTDEQEDDEEPAVSDETAETTEAEEKEQDKENLFPEIPDSVFEKEDGDTTPDETEEMVIEKTVQVVTPEEAVDIIDKGEEVWTDNSEPVKKEDLVTVPEEEKKEEVEKDEEPVENSENIQETDTEEHDSGRDNDAHEDYTDDGNDKKPESQRESRTEQKHVHNWVEKTKTVHHDAEGHYEDVQVDTETVVDEPAWDEPMYEWICECNECGEQFTSSNEAIKHTAIKHGGGSYSNDQIQVDTIHHPAVTHEEPVYEEQWLEDSPAYDEEVTTGYYCSECGATQ